MTTIREALPTDADAIGHVHVEAWRAAYRGMMPEAFLASLDGEARAARWRDRISGWTGTKRLLVAVNERDELVGFAGVGPAREPGERGEIYMINVAPSAWGTGAATALLARATHALAELGHREAILWVVRQNARARRFYQREGWSHEGDRREAIAENGFTFDVDELRYVRSLVTEPAPAGGTGGRVIQAAHRFAPR